MNLASNLSSENRQLRHKLAQANEMLQTLQESNSRLMVEIQERNERLEALETELEQLEYSYENLLECHHGDDW